MVGPITKTKTTKQRMLRVHQVSLHTIPDWSKALLAFVKSHYTAKFRFNNYKGGGGSPHRMAASSVAAPRAIPHDVNDVQGFVCEVCACSWGTQRGLSQHMRLAHPTEYNIRNIQQVGNSSNRNKKWLEDESTALAVLEATAMHHQTFSSERAMSTYLSSIFSGRTLSGIIGQRRKVKHQQLVQRELASIRSVGSITALPSSVDNHVLEITPPAGEMSNSMVIATEVENHEGTVRNLLRQEIEVVLAKMQNRTHFKAKMLLAAARASLKSDGRSTGHMEWLSAVAVRAPRKVSRPQVGNTNSVRRSVCKRDAYAVMQKQYRKAPKKAANCILGKTKNAASGPTVKAMTEFWGNMFGIEGATYVEDTNTGTKFPSFDECVKLCGPISLEEVTASLPKRGTACGIDGIEPTMWRTVPRDHRRLFYNILLFSNRIAEDFVAARTVFIPKIDNPEKPDEFRPISVTSVVLRQFHTILARRLQKLYPYHPDQRGFSNADGTGENLFKLKAILSDARKQRNELHMVSIDLHKAFDSVSHEAVINTLSRIGCPTSFVQYIARVYGNASTNLQYRGSSMYTRVKKGVLQGDPLSPILFNLVLDRALAALNCDLGYSLGNHKFTCIAYADDIILLSGSISGLQLNLNILTSALGKMGLVINANKTSVLSMIPQGKEKRVVYATDQKLKVNNVYIRQIGPTDKWKYLGINFTGNSVCRIKPTLMEDAIKVRKAPLKPQQRLHILRSILIPRYIHELVLGGADCTLLKDLDRKIRGEVRRWLKLPNDVPIAYMHAPLKSGGLGIPNLALGIPRMRLKRINGFLLTASESANAFGKSNYCNFHKQLCEEELGTAGCGEEKDQYVRFWENEMAKKIDTGDLLQAKYCTESSSWLNFRSNNISGRDFIRYNLIRAGCLPSKARRARGRSDLPHSCRAGCASSETNSHILQVCHRTRGGRSLRHNRAMNLIYEYLLKRGVRVYREPIFETCFGLRKPDLISIHGQTAVVSDIHIVDGYDMRSARSAKKAKYQQIPDLADLIAERFGCNRVIHEPVTISYKGIFERSTTKLLTDCLKLSRRRMFQVSTSVLYGSWLNWSSFNRDFWIRGIRNPYMG